MTTKNPFKLGIALAGGGARGIAHIGVLKALEENGIFPDCVSGTSAGSIIGALYAAGRTPDEMLEFVVANSSLLKVVRFGLPTAGLTKLTALREALDELIPEDSFESLKKPLFLAICNLTSGQLEVRNSGVLYDVVVASCSIPIIFQAITLDNQIYVDGGLMMNLPAEPLYACCDKVLGVNVMPNVAVKNDRLDGLMDIGMRCFEMTVAANTELQLAMCHAIIEPKALYDFHPFAFSSYQEIFNIGYQYTMDKMGEIEEKLDLC
ncbi:MAG: patatin-like phospholipase family protein [Bacteroidota bacterium]